MVYIPTLRGLRDYNILSLAEALKTTNLERLDELETIDLSPLLYSESSPSADIDTRLDREIAVERAETTQSTSDIINYSDTSRRESYLSATNTIVALGDNLQVVEPK